MDPQAEIQLGQEMQTIQKLKQPILIGETTRSVTVTSDAPNAVQAIVREYDGNVYVFAVNNEPRPFTVSITVDGLKSNSAVVLGENRAIEIHAGTFIETFAAYQVHLYQIKKQGK